MLSLENALLVPRDYDHRGLRSQYTCSSTLPSRIESADKRKEITISPNRASSKRFVQTKKKDILSNQILESYAPTFIASTKEIPDRFFEDFAVENGEQNGS